MLAYLGMLYCNLVKLSYIVYSIQPVKYLPLFLIVCTTDCSFCYYWFSRLLCFHSTFILGYGRDTPCPYRPELAIKKHTPKKHLKKPTYWWVLLGFLKCNKTCLHPANDAARPLSYKTKTAFFKLLTQDHWRSQKVWLRGAQIGKKFCDVILVLFFGDVMVMTSLKWRHHYILKFNFVIISFKNHHLAKSRNFRSPILEVMRRWGRKDPSAWRFWKFITK